MKTIVELGNEFLNYMKLVRGNPYGCTYMPKSTDLPAWMVLIRDAYTSNTALFGISPTLEYQLRIDNISDTYAVAFLQAFLCFNGDYDKAKKLMELYKPICDENYVKEFYTSYNSYFLISVIEDNHDNGNKTLDELVLEAQQRHVKWVGKCVYSSLRGLNSFMN